MLRAIAAEVADARERATYPQWERKTKKERNGRAKEVANKSCKWKKTAKEK